MGYKCASISQQYVVIQVLTDASVFSLEIVSKR